MISTPFVLGSIYEMLQIYVMIGVASRTFLETINFPFEGDSPETRFVTEPLPACRCHVIVSPDAVKDKSVSLKKIVGVNTRFVVSQFGLYEGV